MSLSPGSESSRIQTATLISDAVTRLTAAATLERVMDIVTETARTLAGADGATFVLREGNKCYYADEVSISPLWKGQRFPLEACVSGWSMLHRETVVIEDIYQDPRVPFDAYRATFVKSLCVVPIRAEKPLGAIGTYWSAAHTPDTDEIKVLELLANSAAIALENLELKRALIERSQAGEDEVERTLNTIAHDLRSPVSTMTGLADLLSLHLDGKLEEPARGYLKSLSATGHFACRRMDRLLNLYKVSGRRLELERVDLTEVSQDVVGALRVVSRAQDIRFEADPSLIAMADPVLIRSVIENLLSNAVKYSSKRPHSEIRFGRSAETDTETTYYVRDNGCGFAPESAGKLFKPMGRLHDDREYAGSGLGLVSVARIVELHGGRVRAESERDRGATFSFTLPKTPPN